jgi:hypothetical protein
MRIRTIKPEFWSNEKMARLPDYVKLMAIALLNYADDDGYFWANPLMIRGALFPFDEDSTKARRALEHLSAEGYLRLGKTVDGREFGHVINFAKHQRVDRKTDSLIKPLEDVANSTNPRRTLDERSSLDRKGSEGKGSTLPAAPKAAVVTDPRHHQITSRWSALYETEHGFAYKFDTKDAATLKRFLGQVADTPETFFGVAAAAWRKSKQDRFAKHVKEAATIHGLCTFYNQVRAEINGSGQDIGLVDAEIINRQRA